MTTTSRCYDPKAIILVELESAAVVSLLDDSYRDLKDWEEWEPRHEARSPLRLVVQSAPHTASFGLRVYRIPMRCEQAEALREWSEELAEKLDVMPGQEDRDAAAVLTWAARALNEAIRTPLRDLAIGPFSVERSSLV
jgi:hypothetical protein